jgi:hypothetical protein
MVEIGAAVVPARVAAHRGSRGPSSVRWAALRILTVPRWVKSQPLRAWRVGMTQSKMSMPRPRRRRCPPACPPPSGSGAAPPAVYRTGSPGPAAAPPPAPRPRARRWRSRRTRSPRGPPASAPQGSCMPPWTMPKRAAGLSPWAGRERAAQRRESSMEPRPPDPPGRGALVEDHHDVRAQRPLHLHGDLGAQEDRAAVHRGAEAHPLLRDLAQLAQAEDLEAPGVGQDGASQCMKPCRSPQRRMTSVPGRSIRWKVLPRMIWAPSPRAPRGSWP